MMHYLTRKAFFSAAFIFALVCGAVLCTTERLHANEPKNITITFDYDKDLTWTGAEKHPFRFPKISPDSTDTYAYAGLIWEKLGIVKWNTYYTNDNDRLPRQSGNYSDRGYRWLSELTEFSNVAYIDSGLPAHITPDTANDVKSFRFIGGNFMPVHWEFGGLEIRGVDAIGGVYTQTFDLKLETEDLSKTWIEWEYVNVDLIDLYFTPVGIFSGPLIDLEDLPLHIAFDNLTFGSGPTIPEEFDTVPEPASLLLFAAGTFGLVSYRVRRKRA